ncbi:MAG: 16S rRNA (adenine(1518)-N(6)/adenine(1519)-N(6))-dimethyltransferase RsmA [Sulfolobales archaeon]
MWRFRELEKITKYVLRSYGIRLKKKLSQHFVVDEDLVNEILHHTAKFQPLRVVEVGTGLGILTAGLGSVAKYVVTIELDQSLAKVASVYLSREVGDGIIDILIGDGISLIRSGLREADVLVSNVPYSITGPLINSIIKSNCRVAVLTLQKEVAERLAAQPGSKSYSRLTVMVNTFMDVELGGLYPPESFVPHPEVYSRVVILKRLRMWDCRWESYEHLIKCLFNQKRKLIKKVLRCCLNEDLTNEFNLGIAPLIEGKRVYQLPAETFLKIYSILYSENLT